MDLDEPIACRSFMDAWKIALSDEPAGGLNDAVKAAAESRARLPTHAIGSAAPGGKP